MKIINLTEKSKIYTSNVFFVQGDWNAIDDVNTLIDAGSDLSILDELENLHTGLGQKKIDQIILTHSHSDHTGTLEVLIEMYRPRVYSFNQHLKEVTHILSDGALLKIGDKYFEVFHITAHSYDSICLLYDSEGVFFTGDTSFPIEFENLKLSEENANVLERLDAHRIKTIYPGHGPTRDFTNRRFQLLKDKVL
jgi:glyoxylase-like metal-dependent hydrolase (beta-lactamase superfamily II)